MLDENGNPETGPVTVYPRRRWSASTMRANSAPWWADSAKKRSAAASTGGPRHPSGGQHHEADRRLCAGGCKRQDHLVHRLGRRPGAADEDEATGEKKDWPRNFSGTYSNKPFLVADALARSINTIAVRVGEKVGVGNIYRFTTKELGITSFVAADKDSGPMILGSSTTGVTPEEMAGAYSIFGSGGSFTTIHSYTSVQRGTGATLLEPQVKTKQVVYADTAYIMNRLLAGVMQGQGTGAGYCGKRRHGLGRTRPARPATTATTGSSASPPTMSPPAGTATTTTCRWRSTIPPIRRRWPGAM